MRFLAVVSLASACCALAAQNDKIYDTTDDIEAGSDLFKFVTRPDIRAPRWNMTKHRPDAINPGYYFVSPYTYWQSIPDRLEYQPYQVGPHIYDGDGNLVWSGAVLVQNRNTFDFRTFDANGTTYLSYALLSDDREGAADPNGTGVILGPSYNAIQRMPGFTDNGFNAHEFKVHDNGDKVLMIGTQGTELKGLNGNQAGWFSDDCIHEINLKKDELEFSWCPLDHGVRPNESYHQSPELLTLTSENRWDYLHGNSIDKFANGDYLYSARHTNTLYRVSRENSSIVWRLGGKISDFTMDFNFSSQHHAVIHSENGTTAVITFLDNASDDSMRQPNTASASSGKMVELDMERMEAKLLKQWDRPDGGLSVKRGNVHIMPNDNVLVGWSDSGYMSEHTMDNELVMEASFASSRFSTYRVFKSNFTGLPEHPPVLKSFVVKSQSDKTYSMTTSYVSWNGATDITDWKFYGAQNATGDFKYIGQARKTGFETAFSEKGEWKFVYAEAIAKDGSTLGKSRTRATSPLQGYAPSEGKTHFPKLSHTATRIGEMSKGAVAAGSVFIVLALQMTVVALYLVFKRSRRPDLGNLHSPAEDRVQLLSAKEWNDS
ncbi:hypothetical protein H2202_009207 [Exophiala xenobiotica]|nr:hypothetical protein H2202_009207 [Exophiala xenobiotica]KAK5360527.1 hypothetical protein LTS13_010090 [Exophiala xenobiotica]KAK5468124.1 hypothetical protein LTR20_002468 [Exophiala xenobiotica]KAK5501346.1 hypothetical protein LTR83_003026 [Exophiala xenobiotica]KAK5517683.1 hypothetical protein LTR21_002681 [Exophiala xenobiotica]